MVQYPGRLVSVRCDMTRPTKFPPFPYTIAHTLPMILGFRRPENMPSPRSVGCNASRHGKTAKVCRLYRSIRI